MLSQKKVLCDVCGLFICYKAEKLKTAYFKPCVNCGVLHCNCSSLAFSPQKRLRGFVFLGYLGPASLELLCFFPQSSLWRCIRPLLIPFAASSTYLESEGNSVADILISWVNIPWACLSVSLHVCVCAHARVCVADIDECKDRPCFNNATCVRGAGAFTCVCEPGYTGVLCETGERGESRHHSPEEIFSAAFYIKLSLLADASFQRASQST